MSRWHVCSLHAKRISHALSKKRRLDARFLEDNNLSPTTTHGQIYTPELLKSLVEYTGVGCGFPGDVLNLRETIVGMYAIAMYTVSMPTHGAQNKEKEVLKHDCKRTGIAGG